jgi:hypothetical protein
MVMAPVAMCCVPAMLAAAAAGATSRIGLTKDGAVIRAGIVERRLAISGARVATESLTVAGRQMLLAAAPEFSMTVAREAANRKPIGIDPRAAGDVVVFTSTMSAGWSAEGIDPSRYNDSRPDGPKWVDERRLETGGPSLGLLVGKPEIGAPQPGTSRLTAHVKASDEAPFAGVEIELVYEVYDGFPAIRKWARVRNAGSHWLRLSRMTIDDAHIASSRRTALAAAMFGVQPSVVAFEGPGSRWGLIAASEVPSALRSISDNGAMGYSTGLFEWVLGPGEEFTTEPVFYYGYAGEVTPTISAVSTPLDRAVEGPYQDFVHRHLGVAAAKAPMHGPQWMTWAYFYDKIDDTLVRQLADIASRAGFTEMLFDDGWQKGRLGTEIDTTKFPDFAATAAYVRERGLQLGLWVSCFRDSDSKDLRDMPNARVLPLVVRGPSTPGFAMSFTSPWRDYFVKDLVELARRYGVTYFKQDFTNIMFGDLAEGHESRTRREALLRGLRALLDTQAALRREAPEVVNEITHEIYWGTPGVPADLAALKTAARFHIPPNECIGSDIAREHRGRTIGPAEHAADLRRGCWLARQRFFSHRGMPLYALEFYAAATTNHQGSLTPDIQDRQVASWLMGAPVCFSGDSRTLTDANIVRYRERLDAVKRLQERYGIYRNFQFSGVPEPTDLDWHWWGKLNAEGSGAVVVIRGSGGAAERAVNIPWVRPGATYRVTGLFSGKHYGVATGRALREAGLRIVLPPYGQELLEVSKLK